jgi:hypothetical protein
MPTTDLILPSIMGAFVALFGWLRARDLRDAKHTKAAVSVTHTEVASLKDSEKRCRLELTGCRVDLENLHRANQDREQQWRAEKDKFQEELTRQERSRHDLTYENNKLLAEKCTLLERLVAAAVPIPIRTPQS